MPPVAKILIFISLVGGSLATVEKYQFKFGVQDKGRVVEEKTGAVYSAVVRKSVLVIDFPEHIYGVIVNVRSVTQPTVVYENNQVIIKYKTYNPKPNVNVGEDAQKKNLFAEYEVIVYGTEYQKGVASN